MNRAINEDIKQQIFSTFLSSPSSRSAKYIVMLPCNSDDENDDSWIHTSHNQFKHEQTGLCIGDFKAFT